MEAEKSAPKKKKKEFDYIGILWGHIGIENHFLFHNMLGKNVYTLISPYNLASLAPIPLIFKLETR